MIAKMGVNRQTFYHSEFEMHFALFRVDVQHVDDLSSANKTAKRAMLTAI